MKQTSSKNLEILNREEALNKSSLVPSNKGFNLMLKMGYQVGNTLGKPTTSKALNDLDEIETPNNIKDKRTKHLMEPIKVTLKSDRAGLGQQEERKQRIDEINEYIKRMNESRSQFVKCTTDQYLVNKKSQFQLRKLRHNLHKAQRICFQLDSTVKVKIKINLNTRFYPCKKYLFYIIKGFKGTRSEMVLAKCYTENFAC
jgi:hypothetical protein